MCLVVHHPQMPITHERISIHEALKAYITSVFFVHVLRHMGSDDVEMVKYMVFALETEMLDSLVF
jgi:hypothetical protein